MHLTVGILLGRLAEYLLCTKEDKAVTSCDDFGSTNVDVRPQQRWLSRNAHTYGLCAIWYGQIERLKGMIIMP